MEESAIKLLSKLDLTEAESAVYLHLLKSGVVSAGKLAKISRYSRPKVYDILEKLVKIGLAESFPARPIKFRALNPEISIPSYLNLKKQELDDAESRLKSSLKELFEIAPLKESGVFITQGLRKSSAKYCELVRNAKKQTYSLLGWVSKQEVENLINAHITAQKNGIVTNLAYFQNKIFKEQIGEKDVERLSRIVTHFYPIPFDRLPVPNPPLNFLVVDDHSVHVTVGNYLDEGTLKDVISIHYYNMPAFSSVIKKLFPTYFKLLFSRFG